MQDRILDYDEFALHVLKQELANRFNYLWKCKNGSVVNVKDMTTSHLTHAVNMLEEYLEQKEIIQENYLNEVWG